jgi:hypothetical protein
MTRTGLAGPYRLSFDEIDAALTRTSAGVYALGYPDTEGRFCINHIGRADKDLRARLMETIGSDVLFKYGYFSSAKTAFEKECELFHDIRPPGNRIHPDRPRGTQLECPRCRIFR